MHLHLFFTLFSLTTITLVRADYYEYEFPSSSSEWKLSEERRRHLRQFGHCAKLCGFGYDAEADGYDNFVRHFLKTKHTGEFRELIEVLDYDDVPGELTDMLKEIDVRESDGFRTQ